MSMKKGNLVCIFGTDSVLNRTPHLVGQIGVISSIPVHPTTWYKVQFSDGNIITFRPSALRAIPSGVDPMAFAQSVARSCSSSHSSSLTSSSSAQAHRGNDQDSLVVKTRLQQQSVVGHDKPKRFITSTSNERNTTLTSSSSSSFFSPEFISVLSYRQHQQQQQEVRMNPAFVRRSVDMKKASILADYFDKFSRHEDSDAYVYSDADGQGRTLFSKPSTVRDQQRYHRIELAVASPLFDKQLEMDISSSVCHVCYLDKGRGGKFCWNEGCSASPVYYKLVGARGVPHGVAPPSIASNDMSSLLSHSSSTAATVSTTSGQTLIISPSNYHENQHKHHHLQIPEPPPVYQRMAIIGHGHANPSSSVSSTSSSIAVTSTADQELCLRTSSTDIDDDDDDNDDEEGCINNGNGRNINYSGSASIFNHNLSPQSTKLSAALQSMSNFNVAAETKESSERTTKPRSDSNLTDSEPIDTPPAVLLGDPFASISSITSFDRQGNMFSMLPKANANADSYISSSASSSTNEPMVVRKRQRHSDDDYNVGFGYAGYNDRNNDGMKSQRINCTYDESQTESSSPSSRSSSVSGMMHILSSASHANAQ